MAANVPIGAHCYVGKNSGWVRYTRYESQVLACSFVACLCGHT